MFEQKQPHPIYKIVIKGHLDAQWRDWFDDLSLELTDDGNTALSGAIVDQAALHGVLKKINNLGLTLISVTPQERNHPMQEETITRKQAQTLNASFQQKSAGVSLFIISIAALYYFARVWPMRPIALAGTPIPDGYAALVIGTLFVIALTQIVLQSVLAIGAGSAPKATPQEQIAALKAGRNGRYVMIVGVLAVVGLLFVGFPAFCLANFAMFGLLLAEIVRYASELVYYRSSK
jgi:hypothetical protein